MYKTESKYCPKVITLLLHKRIAFNLEKITRETEEGESETFYQYDEVVVSRSADRNDMIRAIIHQKYKIDDEIALINNHLYDPDNSTYAQEYTDYQERRQFAKDFVDVIRIQNRSELETMTVTQLNNAAQLLDIAVRTDGWYDMLKDEKIDTLCEMLGITII
jgi:hypothetical protein